MAMAHGQQIRLLAESEAPLLELEAGTYTYSSTFTINRDVTVRAKSSGTSSWVWAKSSAHEAISDEHRRRHCWYRGYRHHRWHCKCLLFEPSGHFLPTPPAEETSLYPELTKCEHLPSFSGRVQGDVHWWWHSDSNGHQHLLQHWRL
mgnify:CR=1 FL=1